MNKSKLKSLLHCWLYVYIIGVASTVVAATSMNNNNMSLVGCAVLSIFGLIIPRVILFGVAVLDSGNADGSEITNRALVRSLAAYICLIGVLTTVLAICIWTACAGGMSMGISYIVIIGVNTGLDAALYVCAEPDIKKALRSGVA